MTRVQTLVIGAGQAGLAVGYHLARRGAPFVILEARDRIGDVWRKRWDSLRLFTSARFDGLPGMRFPASGDAFPTKDEMADYLERYAARFELPVCRGVAVDRVWRDGDRYFVSSTGARFEAEHVVIAMANLQRPLIPSFGDLLAPGIVRVHSCEYRNAHQLRDGGVLVVGAGNSGAEIALELARAGRRVWLSGRDTGEVPFRIDGTAARLLLNWLVLRLMFHRVLTTDTVWGQRRRPHAVSRGGSLIRIKQVDLNAAGVVRVPRTVGVRDGLPVLADGRALAVSNVVWCTGFSPRSFAIDVPIFDRHGEPQQYRGVVTSEPGLYFVGRRFLYAMSSAMIHGVDRDAAHVAETIARRVGVSRRPAGSPALQSAWW
jgi:putative flavoprotein involved in K+ transport